MKNKNEGQKDEEKKKQIRSERKKNRKKEKDSQQRTLKTCLITFGCCHVYLDTYYNRVLLKKTMKLHELSNVLSKRRV